MKTIMALFLYGAILCIGALPWSSLAFHTTAPTTTIHQAALVRHGPVVPVVQSQHVGDDDNALLRRRRQRFHGAGPLLYRELDENDDDTTMLKVQTRTPIGYDARKALKKTEQEQQQQQKRGGKASSTSDSNKNRTALNLPLILALELNQLLIFTTGTFFAAFVLFFFSGYSGFFHLNEIFPWTGNYGSGAAFWDLQVTPQRLLEGIAGAIPLLVLGNFIEGSDNRAFANVNFSTIAMTMTLFGRRSSPPQDFVPDRFKGKTIATTPSWAAFFHSFALSTLTGFCEETVFRAEIPAILTRVFKFDITSAIVGQALLFGLGHAQPYASRAENSILIGLQFLNGLLLGQIYVLSGGDIVVCMVAHALYDLVTFYKTWSDANDQLEYAEKMSTEPLPPNVESELRRVLAKTPNVKLDPNALKVVKRLFYIFDFDKNKFLSKSEVRKGISYLALERAGVPPPQKIVDQAFEQVVKSRDDSMAEERDRLSFSDFIRLYTTMYNIRPASNKK